MTELLLPKLRVNTTASDIHSYRKPSSRKTTPPQKAPAQSLSRAIHDAKNAVLQWRYGLTASEREARRIEEERKAILAARIQNATTFKQWDAAAHELDVLEGNEEWKEDDTTGDYDPELIEERLRALDSARSDRDVRSMMHLVRTALTRDLGGLGNVDLYRHSHCGTKKLIERYVDSALQTINALAEQSALELPGDLDPRDVSETFLYARQSFGRSALLLSGGGTFGMSHIGVLKALFERKLLPRIISGASAGSIVCAVACCTPDDQIPQLLIDFPHGDLAVFEDASNADTLLDHLRRLLTEGSWSDIQHLTRVMRDLLGDITFQEAYNRTRRICNICVSSANIYELPRLLNYVSAPNVMIWSAVAASCSVPFVFTAAPLLVKNPVTGEHSPWNPTPQRWIDGSVDNDLPMTRLAEMFNVNHFIVSQVNPHVVPFLAKEDAPYPVTMSRSPAGQDQSDFLYTVTRLAKSEALHRMQILAEIGIFPTIVTKLRSVLSQKYSGDINILPAIGVMDLPKILTNPTTDFMHRSCLLGERATWPKMSRIRDRCAIELALDRAVHSLRARVVFSKSQVELRRMVTVGITNLQRGSHEPLSSMVPPAKNDMVDGHIGKRRRSSISALNTDMGQSRYTNDTFLEELDDATDNEEGRLEMPVVQKESKPKRKTESFPNSDLLRSGPQTTPSLTTLGEPNAFKFDEDSSTEERAPDPAVSRTSMPAAESLDKSPDFAAVDDASYSSSDLPATYLDNMDGSDPQRSDADFDSQSDESLAGHLDESSSDLIQSPIQKEWLHETAPLERNPPPQEDLPFEDTRQSGSRKSSIPDVDLGAGLWQ